MANVDAQGRPDLLNSERAIALAQRILDSRPNANELAWTLIEIEQHGLTIGRSEVGVGSPYMGGE